MRNVVKGFTLIELLVVIAIIGILASIVMVSLNSTRNRGVNSSVKSSMVSIRNAASIYFNSVTDGNGTYGESMDGWVEVNPNGSFSGNIPMCKDDTEIFKLLTAVAKTSNQITSCVVGDGGKTYVVYVPNIDPATSFCVDSMGFVGEVNSNQIANLHYADVGCQYY